MEAHKNLQWNHVGIEKNNYYYSRGYLCYTSIYIN